MNKQHILEEITRTAAENGGIPLGAGRFANETGIQKTDWFGKYWARWGDALQAAGFSANTLQTAHSREFLFQKLIELTRELGKIPAKGDFLLKAREQPGFPSNATFARHFGGKTQLVSTMLKYVKDRAELDDIVRICEAFALNFEERSEGDAEIAADIGFVYLFKAGKHYKIGRSNSAGRRERELQLLQPEKCQTVHTIRTDDSVGIERYWHQRFDSRRKNGERFELASDDVKAFKRRKFM